VSVEDTGLGIPEEKLQAVFEAFEQVSCSGCSEGKGGKAQLH
jgi:signal transduction histidine kinase